MVQVWALVQPRKWLFWVVFSQFVLFHAISWSIVAFFYPILMAGIISIFPLRRIFPEAPGNDLADLVRLRLPGPIYALLAVFAALQFVPFLYRGDPAWTAQGRLFTLHMFEGRSNCRVWATEKFSDRSARDVNLFRKDLFPREMCDPLVYFNGAQGICRDLPQHDPGFLDLDLHMSMSKRTSPAWRPLVEVQDFCSKHVHYNALLPNDWILPLRGE
jgi:hypothetical protein